MISVYVSTISMMISNLQHALSSFAESGTTPQLDLSPIWEILKILIPAVGVWLASRATSRKDQRESELRQQDRLATSWEGLTAQSREIISGLQKELVDVRAGADHAEKRAEHAEQEVEKLKRKTEQLQQEYNELQEDFVGLQASFLQLKKDYADVVKELEARR